MDTRTLRELLPIDIPPPTRDFLLYVAATAAAASQAAAPDRVLQASLIGNHLLPVLAHVADLEDRLAQIADSLQPCTPVWHRAGALCPHGAWPCPPTEAAWLARGLDPAEQVAAIPEGPATRQQVHLDRDQDQDDEGDEARDCVRMWLHTDDNGQLQQWCGYHRTYEPIDAGCPVCGAETRDNVPCANRPAGSPPETASCADLAAEAATR